MKLETDNRIIGLVICAVLVITAKVNGTDNKAKDCIIDDIDMCDYESHAEMLTKLEELVKKYPQISKTGSIGKSVKGKDLRYIKISKNLAKRTTMTPTLKYIANIHGDESVGRQLLIYLAQYLLNNYERDEGIQILVNKTDIYILPTANPDGFEITEPEVGETDDTKCRHQNEGRNNGNGEDLNRNLPDIWQSSNWTKDKLKEDREPETQALIDWNLDNPGVLAANLHGGTMVSTVPYDSYKNEADKQAVKEDETGQEISFSGPPSSPPDEDICRFISNQFVKHHKRIRTTSGVERCTFMDTFAPPFKKGKGIVNGAHWYAAPGSMPDFHYAHGTIDITFELSCCKYPPKTDIKKYWTENKKSLLEFSSAVHIGVKGIV